MLRLLGRVALDDTQAARAGALLSGNLDWDLLLSLAEPHGLAPLLHWHLSRLFPGRVPAASARRLEDQFRANLQANLKLTAELVRILKLLDAQKITAIPFKGAVLAVALYGNLALREFGDLDLILRSDDILRARDTLLADGYLPEYDLSPVQEKALLASDCQYTFQKFDGQLRVELHWDIVPRYVGLHFARDRWFARCENITLAATTIPSLSPEDLLLVLCVHGAKHGWQRLAWITDVAELLRTYPGLNWQYIAKEADAAEARPLLRLGLGLAHRLLERDIPAEWRQEIQQDAVIQSMLEEVCLGLTRTIQEPWELHRFLLRTMRPAQRLRYLVRSALTPTPAEWGLVNLPPFLSPLYSILRLARLSAKYVARVARFR